MSYSQTPQRTIQRPLEYDPTLAQRTALSQSQQLTQKFNEFGFDETDINDEKTNDNENSNVLDELKQQVSSMQTQLNTLQSTHTTLQQQYNTAVQSNNEYEIRIEELKKISTHSKSILINKFKQQIKTLMSTVEEQKSLIADDEVEIKALQQRIDTIKQGNSSDTNTNVQNENDKLKLELRTAQTQLIELRAKLDTVQQNSHHDSTVLNDSVAVDTTVVEQLHSEISQLKQQLQAAQTAPSSSDSSSVVPVAAVDTTQLTQLQQQHTDTTSQLNERTQQYNELKQSTQQTIDSLTQQLATLQQQYNTLSATTTANNDNAVALHTAQQHIVALENTVNELNTLCQKKDTELITVRDKAKEKLLLASDNIKTLKTEYGTLREKYRDLLNVHEQCKTTQSNVQGNYTKLQNTVKTLQQQHSTIKAELQKFNITQFESLLLQSCKQLQSQSQHRITTLETNYAAEMKLRRQYFNTIQELRGNIRVYVRIRPSTINDSTVIQSIDNGELVVYNSEKQSNSAFEFDHIFNATSTQVDVYNQVSDLVLSVLDGYNVCIFAYGQTGSGKTYTMQGPTTDPGVNVRALTSLFDIINNRVDTWSYKVSVSLLEIYNDNICDLLGNNSEYLKARESVNGSIEVPGLTQVSVQTSAAVLEQLKLGSKNRNVRKTDMNDLSSRSHLILSVYVTATNKLNNKELQSKLHLIDLAGSERISRSNVTGDALKEAQNINSSLSALGNVIASRANKNAHTPYRDSSLTWLLKDSLEKNSKTLVVCQISPDNNDVSETICSLKFASRAREVELGKATANVNKLSMPSSAIKRSTSKLSDV